MSQGNKWDQYLPPKEAPKSKQKLREDRYSLFGAVRTTPNSNGNGRSVQSSVEFDRNRHEEIERNQHAQCQQVQHDEDGGKSSSIPSTTATTKKRFKSMKPQTGKIRNRPTFRNHRNQNQNDDQNQSQNHNQYASTNSSNYPPNKRQRPESPAVNVWDAHYHDDTDSDVNVQSEQSYYPQSVCLNNKKRISTQKSESQQRFESEAVKSWQPDSAFVRDRAVKKNRARKRRRNFDETEHVNASTNSMNTANAPSLSPAARKRRRYFAQSDSVKFAYIFFVKWKLKKLSIGSTVPEIEERKRRKANPGWSRRWLQARRKRTECVLRGRPLLSSLHLTSTYVLFLCFLCTKSGRKHRKNTNRTWKR